MIVLVTKFCRFSLVHKKFLLIIAEKLTILESNLNFYFYCKNLFFMPKLQYLEKNLYQNSVLNII